MTENQRYVMMFLLLSIAMVFGGIGLKGVLKYAPDIGSFLGFLFFLACLFFKFMDRAESSKAN
ncbi:hypothetical protein [Sediminibacillus massiliensis]|uniref:hypothetical protein n=1 Tax=Sediminibacillus massiliensis TaxID=1926277 RepID=UPI0009887144|nr:hypothetical protein [Sediminibacillus massiliensis]